MKIKVKSIVCITAALLASASVFIVLNRFYGAESTVQTQEPEGIPVAIAVATEEQVPVALTGIGELEATRQVMITSETGGLITRILFRPGESVEEGQTLIQLNDAPQQGELDRLKAASTNAKAQLARTRLLFNKQISTQQELDQALANWQQLQGEIAKTQALIEQKRIKAPFKGVLGIRKVNVGQFVHAGDAMVSLTDPRVMFANITLPERLLPQIKRDQQMNIMVDAYPEQTFKGRVSTIESVVDRGTRTVQVQATVNNPDNVLSSGMYARGQVYLATPKKIVRIPETAVSYNAYGDFVYVVSETKAQVFSAKQVYIRTGEKFNGQVAIDKGIHAGDKVITSGQLRLTNGSVVKILSTDTLAVENNRAAF